MNHKTIYGNKWEPGCQGKDQLLSSSLSQCFGSVGIEPTVWHQFFQVGYYLGSMTVDESNPGIAIIDQDSGTRITCGLCGHTRLLLANGDVEIEE